MIEEFAAFAMEMPAWCGPNGMPKSWKHYVYGKARMHRARAEAEHRMAVAMRMAQAGEETRWIKYLNDARTCAGLTR